MLQVHQKIFIQNEDEWFWIDTVHAKHVVNYHCVLEQSRMRLRATIGGYRHTLQYYLVNHVWKRQFDNVYFLNGDRLDFRYRNLVPYDPLAVGLDTKELSYIRAGKKPRYRGVSLHRPSGLWQAVVYWKGKMTHLGYFSKPEIAAEFRRKHVTALIGPVWAARMASRLKVLPHKRYQPPKQFSKVAD